MEKLCYIFEIGGKILTKTLYLKRLLDWGHTVEFEVSETDLPYKVKMKSGPSTIRGQGKDFWQALTDFLTNATFSVPSLKPEEKLGPLANMVVPGTKVELAKENSSLSVKVNGKPTADPLAKALTTALA